MSRRRQKEARQLQQQGSVSVTYRGRLPIASQFKAFNDAVPGTGERLTAMAERDQQHLHRMEEKALQGDLSRSMLGLIFAFVLAVILVAGGIYLLANGHSTEGYLTGGTPIAVLLLSFASKFISQQRRRSRSRQPGE